MCRCHDGLAAAGTRNALIWLRIKLTPRSRHTHSQESSLQVERLLSINKLQLQGQLTTFLEWNALAAIYISTSRELLEREARRVLELWYIDMRDRRLDINLSVSMVAECHQVSDDSDTRGYRKYFCVEKPPQSRMIIYRVLRDIGIAATLAKANQLTGSAQAKNLSSRPPAITVEFPKRQPALKVDELAWKAAVKV